MTDPIQYIRQQLQMRELDVDFQDFRFLSFSDKKHYQLNACNQHLFIEIAKLPQGTIITGDNNAIEVSHKHKEVQAWEEFTGIVTIDLKEEEQGGIEYILILTSKSNK